MKRVRLQASGFLTGVAASAEALNGRDDYAPHITLCIDRRLPVVDRNERQGLAAAASPTLGCA